MRVLRLICALLAAAALLAGCSDDEPRPESPSTPTVSAPPSSAPSRTTPSAQPRTTPSAQSSTGSAGSEGFTVRYIDADGQVQTLQPKDFPR